MNEIKKYIYIHTVYMESHHHISVHNRFSVTCSAKPKQSHRRAPGWMPQSVAAPASVGRKIGDL